MKIIFIPTWNVKHVDTDDIRIQAPDKKVTGSKYWFFKYFPDETTVDIIDIGKKSSFQKLEQKIKFYIVQPIKAFKQRNKYDIVISHGAQSGLVYELLTSFVKIKPKHLMFDIGGLNGARINNFETPLIKFALRKNPYIIVHSSEQLSLYKNSYPNLSKNAHFIPFGADVEYFSTNNHKTPLKKTIVSFGYLKRDYTTLCNAFIASNKTDITLYIIGDDSLQSDYANHPNIVFLKRIPLKELIEHILQSWAVVVPLPVFNYSYGQMSFLQSMAMKKALIVTKTPSSQDYIKNTKGIIGVSPYNVDDMIKAIETITNKTSAEIKEMGEENYRVVSQFFNEKNMATQIYNYIITSIT